MSSEPLAPEPVRALLSRVEVLRLHCIEQIKRADEAEKWLKVEREKVARLEGELKRRKGKGYSPSVDGSSPSAGRP